MPLEISEIGVRMTVGDSFPPPPPITELSPEAHEAVVTECVQRVLQQLKDEQAR